MVTAAEDADELGLSSSIPFITRFPRALYTSDLERSTGGSNASGQVQPSLVDHNHRKKAELNSE